MATKTSEKVLIAGVCLLTALNVASHYQNERREAIRAEADVQREKRVAQAIVAADSLKKTCIRTSRQMHMLGRQLHYMKNMSPTSQEFRAAFENLRHISGGFGDDGDDGGGRGRKNGGK